MNELRRPGQKPTQAAKVVAQPDTPVGRGTTIGRYLLVDELAQGGMGVVYKAYDPELDRPIALKLLQTLDTPAGVLRDRLLREAQALARLSHPNVIAVHDVGVFQGQVFIAVEFVAGQNMRQWLTSQSRSQREIVDVFLAAGAGLAAAHHVGLVHRDFKPDNVMVGDDGRVRVLDFGLARTAEADGGGGAMTESPNEIIRGDHTAETEQPPLIGGRGEATGRPPLALDETAERTWSSPNRLSSPLTRVGAAIGTPRYMAPEQHLGGAIDAAADQFSFCIALYRALYGTFPFRGETEEAVREEVLSGRISDPPSSATVPRWLRQIIVRGLQLRPADRFPSMTALLEALRADPRTTRWRRLRAALVLVSAAAVLAAVIAGALAFKTRRVSMEQARLARQFGQEVEKIDAISRHAWHLPLHDTRHETNAIRARMEKLKDRMRSLGPPAEGPGHEALGRGYIALERFDEVLAELEAAQATGYRSPDLDFALGLVHGKLYQRALARLVKTGDAKLDAVRRQKVVEAHGAPALRYLKELTHDATDAPEYVEGLIALYEERFGDALALARKAGERVLWQYEGLTLEGDIQLVAARDRYWKGKIDEAVELLQRGGEAYRSASALARSGAAAYVGDCNRQLELVEILTDRDQSPEAAVKELLAACANASITRPDDPAPVISQAMAWDCLSGYRSGHALDPNPAWQEAIKLAERALALDPRAVRAYDLLASVHLGMAEHQRTRGVDPRPALEGAQAHARRAVELDARDYDGYRMLTRTYCARGSYEESLGLDPRPSYAAAIESGNTCLKLSPESYNAWNSIGEAYVLTATWQMSHRGDPTEAFAKGEEAFRKAAELSPTLDYGFSNLCEVQRGQAEYEVRQGRDPRPRLEHAIASCEESIRVNPEWAGSSAGLGDAFLALADWQLDHAQDPMPAIAQARAALDRALEIDREHVSALHGLAKSRILEARWAGAQGRDPLAAFATAETLAHRALALRGGKSAETQRLLASLHRWHAEWRAKHRFDVRREVQAGLTAAEQALAENPSSALTAAIEATLHLVAARAATQPVERQAAAEKARVAFGKALEIDLGLEREYRPLEAEAMRLAAP